MTITTSSSSVGSSSGNDISNIIGSIAAGGVAYETAKANAALAQRDPALYVKYQQQQMKLGRDMLFAFIGIFAVMFIASMFFGPKDDQEDRKS